MHSPFVFDFILHVLNNKNNYPTHPEIEKLRKKLLNDNREIEVEDLGAGSRKNNRQKKTISQITSSAAKPKKYAEVLSRLAKHYGSQTIIELGTSLGLTTAYLSKANPSSHVITIEGSASVFQAAAQNLSELGCSNVKMLQGNFDDLLLQVLQEIPPPDLVYIDGNHRYEPTVRYFEQLLPVIHEGSILVFDDIHWSAEMEKAWDYIRQHKQVCYTVDIFFLGFVFFRKEFKSKQDFVVRF